MNFVWEKGRTSEGWDYWLVRLTVKHSDLMIRGFIAANLNSTFMGNTMVSPASEFDSKGFYNGPKDYLNRKRELCYPREENDFSKRNFDKLKKRIERDVKMLYNKYNSKIGELALK